MDMETLLSRPISFRSTARCSRDQASYPPGDDCHHEAGRADHQYLPRPRDPRSDLVEALANGKVLAAGLDVFERKPASG